MRAAGRWPLADDDELCRLLRAEVAAGSEIVAHGWTHRAQGTPCAVRSEHVGAALG